MTILLDGSKLIDTRGNIISEAGPDLDYINKNYIEEYNHAIENGENWIIVDSARAIKKVQNQILDKVLEFLNIQDKY